MSRQIRISNTKCTGRQRKCLPEVVRLVNVLVQYSRIKKIIFKPPVTGLRCGDKRTVRIVSKKTSVECTVRAGNSMQSMLVVGAPAEAVKKLIEELLRGQNNFQLVE